MTIALDIGLGLALIVLCWIDIRQMILPDWLTLPLQAAGLLAGFLEHRPLVPLIVGLATGYLSFVGIEWTYRRVRGRDGLGRGDAKLFAAAGAWVGWAGLPSVILIGCPAALAFVLARRWPADRPLPFGPFLALGFFMVRLFGPLGFDA